MPDRFYPKREAERIKAEMCERITSRVRAELQPMLLSLFRHSDLSDEQINAVYGAAVEKLFGEELARAQAALAVVAVEGSA